jgi:transposase
MADADPRDSRIVELERENAEHRTIIAVQAARIVELEEAIRKLTAKLGQNSLNSSLPPSRDNSDARKKRRSRGKRKRKRGGQNGHKGANRELRPAEEADEIVDHVPDRCGDCGRRLRGLDPDPQRRQIVELPPIKTHLTEHRFHSLPCECGAVTRADTPPELRHGDFGPHLCALVSLLGGGYRMSKRNIRSLLSDVLGIEVSLGAVSNIEARASEELAALHDEALRRIRSSPFVNMDETPWSEGRGSAWLWVATTCEVAYFRIAPERSAAIVEQILGEDFGGIVGNDRAKAYLVIDPEKRQICWFHLGRNFQSKIELGGADARFGRQMRAFERRLWRAQHLFEAGSIDRSSYDRRMKMLRGEVHRAIVGWAASGDPKLGVAAMATNLLQLEPALWTFVDNPHVEPTNNLAERDIRHPVIWRRSSFGTDSSRGSRFVERILTVVATCRKQARSPFRFLADFLTAAWAGHACPPLIHNTS